MKILKDEKIYSKSGYLKSHEITIDLKEGGKGSILGDAIYTIVCADALYSASPADELTEDLQKAKDNITRLMVQSRLESAIELLKEEIRRMEIRHIEVWDS